MDLRKKLDGLPPARRRLMWTTLTAMLTAVYFVLDRAVPPVTESLKVTFAFLSVLAAAMDLAFVIVQRYNRPRIVKMIR